MYGVVAYMDWLGGGLGIFFVFLTGTAGYVRSELTRWMEPERPLVSSTIQSSASQYDKAYRWLQNNPDAQQASRWTINLQTKARDGGDLRVAWQEPSQKKGERGKTSREQLDPLTGQVIAQNTKPRETGGGNTLYAMHYELHYLPYDWAIRIVGICTMFMFVAIISGVITHKKILKDFFTFRPAKGQRSWLDSHNALSVLALPFYLMITYSGLLFFLNAYMPLGVPMVYGFGEENRDRYYSELYPEDNRRGGGARGGAMVGDVAPQFIDSTALVSRMEKEWGPNEVRMASIYPASKSKPAYIELYKASYDGVSRGSDSKQFNLLTGQEIIKEDAQRDAAPMKFSNVMFALHEGRFADAFIRWMYVITGLIGTAMIATGLVLWTVKRRIKFGKSGKVGIGHHIVERLNIGTVAGLPLAIAAYFWANRLLPVGMENRANGEVNWMFIVWLCTFIYAMIRPLMYAWRDVLLLAALSYLLLPVLNAFTTDKHLAVTVPYGDWVLASIDLGFIGLGLLLAWATWKVQAKMQVQTAKPSKPLKNNTKVGLKPELKGQPQVARATKDAAPVAQEQL